ncbi:hypothetical protein [Streptacidiphilus fuscans]|uniref:Uncharacterized protein n=1 Tax=Streptacidiphilus fuscans TaxID=2789292 RepID=A0A931FH09_9ACTN|nr:hypothetical protein [Streptacidiphilus fuscans]MBF9071840.1 hypothetical protein [Streptacidiphilus fuscans]
MLVDPLADQAATLRSQTLAWVRSDYARVFWAKVIEQGGTFVMPAAWQALPHAEQAEALLKMETRRVSDASTFALEPGVLQAVREIGQDTSIPLPFTPDLLPSPTGMLCLSEEEPLASAGGGLLTAVTWGPPLDGFGSGIHLAFWCPPPPELRRPEIPWFPLIQDFDLHLPFAPHWDSRLVDQKVPSGLLYTAVPVRTAVAAFYALTSTAASLGERRPRASVTQQLKQQGAKKRGVMVAAGEPSRLRQSITSRTAELAAELVPEPDRMLVPAPELGELTPIPVHSVFAAERDVELTPAQRRIAHLYREAADHWHRLELQAAQRYPGIWARLEELHARERDRWPSWCWMPSLQVTAVLATSYGTDLDQALWDGPRLAALGAWRSGGRHSFLAPRTRDTTPTDPVPTALVGSLPTPGIGLILDTTSGNHHLIAYMDTAADPSLAQAELVVISDWGRPNAMLESTIKITLYLTTGSVLEAVRATHAHYDDAARANTGEEPPTPSDASVLDHAGFMSQLLWALVDIATGGWEDAGASTGRKLAAPWPPGPGVLPEMTLWTFDYDEHDRPADAPEDM